LNFLQQRRNRAFVNSLSLRSFDMPAVQENEWVVAESYPVSDLKAEGMSPKWLESKWMNVADDMALIPENNVRVIVEDGVVRIEVSVYLMECMRGF